MPRELRPSQYGLVLGVLAFLVLGLTTSVHAQQSLRIEDKEVTGLNSTSMDVLLLATEETEGFVIAVSYPTELVSVSNLRVTGTATDDAGAELVVADVFDATGGFTLGVVLDSKPPFDGQFIAPLATEQVIARFDVTPDLAVNEVTELFFDFEDGINDPPLDNILVQSGFSLGIGPDLTSDSGSLLLLPGAPDELFLADATVPAEGTAAVEVLLSNETGDVQAFVLSVEHEAGVSVESIDIAGTVTDDVGAEFVVATLEANGGTLAVVLDLDEPLDGQTIAVGVEQHIANYVVSCDDPPLAPAPAETFEISFVNGVYGDPLLDNVLVIDNVSIDPIIEDTATITCLALPEPPEENTEFFCGTRDEEGNIVDVEAGPGGEATIELFFLDPDDNIQGFQIAMCLNENLLPIEGTFTTEGGILDAIGAEFAMASIDTDPNDGDGVELTAAILLDSDPPFDGQMTPISDEPLLMASFDVLVSEDAECDACYELEFCNGIDAAETRPIDNLVVVDFESIRNFTLNSCAVCITPGSRFLRGDCNMDGRLDLADPTTVLGAQFQGVEVACEDACDVQDDGKADLADSIYLLTFLYKSGPAPFAPFPKEGLDPTEDTLSCDGGNMTCP